MEHLQGQPRNKQLLEHSTPKREPLLELNKTLSEIDKVTKDLDGTSLTSEQQSNFIEIKGKIIKSTKKFFRVARSVVVEGAIIGSLAFGGVTAINAIGHEINHSALEETLDAGGQTIYTHPDELTTHYLNIIAGRDKFTEDDMKYAEKYPYPVNYYTAHYYNALAGLEAFTVDDPIFLDREDYLRVFAEMQKKGVFFSADEDLNKYVDEAPVFEAYGVFMSNYGGPSLTKDDIKTMMNDGPYFTNDDVKKMEEDVFKSRNVLFTERSLADNRDVYNQVWQLEKECGNPRIRLTKDPTDRHEGSSGVNYAIVSNTAQIGLSDLIIGNNVDFIGEMSHGKQFGDNPWGSSLRGTCDTVYTIFNSVVFRKGFSEEYDRLLYEKPGSIEYQAHKVIQPDLERRYPIMPYLNQIKDKDSK